MKATPFLCLLLLLTGSPVWAQPDAETSADSGQTKASLFSEWEIESGRIEEQLALFNQDYQFPNPKSDPYDTLLLTGRRFQPNEVPRYPANVISQRLYDLPMVISMDYNSYVARYIDVYTVHRRQQVSRMLGLSRVYFPMFEEHLDRMGMPLELKYLSVVESALNPHARSRVGATGLWQFMLGTAQMYGLRVDTYVDERKDPEKSTMAALRYLQNSYQEFGDWLLAIASYNCGPGNVRKAIRRAGGSGDFWAIMEYLPRETRGYVPAFIAATYAFNYAAEHNIFPIYPEFSLDNDTIHLTRIDITLAELSDELRVDLNLLRAMNPELKLDRVPYQAQPYVLRVPPVVAVRYAERERELKAKFGQKRDQLPPEVAARYAAEQVVNPAATSGGSSSSAGESSAPSGKILVYYTVRNGDVVGNIADKYGVTARQISDWNDLRRYRIRAGQKLKIYTTKEKAEAAGARTTPTATAAAAPTRSAAPAPVSPTASSGQAIYHKVQAGDTLWGIARQYAGATVANIQTLNPGIDASDLKVGQLVRVK